MSPRPGTHELPFVPAPESLITWRSWNHLDGLFKCQEMVPTPAVSDSVHWRGLIICISNTVLCCCCCCRCWSEDHGLFYHHSVLLHQGLILHLPEDLLQHLKTFLVITSGLGVDARDSPATEIYVSMVSRLPRSPALPPPTQEVFRMKMSVCPSGSQRASTAVFPSPLLIHRNSLRDSALPRDSPLCSPPAGLPWLLSAPLRKTGPFLRSQGRHVSPASSPASSH